MKARALFRPAKVVAVSNETLARARGALQAFGLVPADLDRLTQYKGDVTIGPTAKHPATRRAVKVTAYKLARHGAPQQARAAKR